MSTLLMSSFVSDSQSSSSLSFRSSISFKFLDGASTDFDPADHNISSCDQ